MSDNLLKFLLVEDDDDHAVLVERSLSKDRIKNSIKRVKDGEEALRFLRNQSPFESEGKPDIILLDLNLPKVNGIEVLKQIKQDPSLTKIPVVIMTTSDAESDRLKAYEHHVNSYLVKPVDFEKFKQMVSDLSLYWGVWNVKAP